MIIPLFDASGASVSAACGIEANRTPLERAAVVGRVCLQLNNNELHKERNNSEHDSQQNGNRISKCKPLLQSSLSRYCHFRVGPVSAGEGNAEGLEVSEWLNNGASEVFVNIDSTAQSIENENSLAAAGTGTAAGAAAGGGKGGGSGSGSHSPLATSTLSSSIESKLKPIRALSEDHRLPPNRILARVTINGTGWTSATAATATEYVPADVEHIIQELYRPPTCVGGLVIQIDMPQWNQVQPRVHPQKSNYIDPPVIGELHTLYQVHLQCKPSCLRLGTGGLGACVAACARTDRPDGLYATVVADVHGIALGLVYSSKASIIEAVQSGRGVYYSRSRQQLWKKGDTSGAVQILKQISLDCDSDAVRFLVQQCGDAARKMKVLSVPSAEDATASSKSSNNSSSASSVTVCGPKGDGMGLPALSRLLQSRMKNAPTGSYTKRLFNDHTLLRNKLLEEAQELSEAQTTDHIAAECADVIYFALVAAIKGGATLEDVEKHLDLRSLKVKRRPGNSKDYRIKAAKEHFENQKQKHENDSSSCSVSEESDKKRRRIDG